MPGYDLKVKGDYPRIESSLCPCCNKILKDAIQTEQGFRLCLSCCDDIQKYPNILNRVEDLEIEPYYPDKAVRREVNKIPVYCELGCEWSGTLGKHETDHKQVCQYKSEDCPNGCGQKLLLDKLDAHLMNECVLRDVNCKYCHTTVTTKDYEKHMSCHEERQVMSTGHEHLCTSRNSDPSVKETQKGTGSLVHSTLEAESIHYDFAVGYSSQNPDVSIDTVHFSGSFCLTTNPPVVGNDRSGESLTAIREQLRLIAVPRTLIVKDVTVSKLSHETMSVDIAQVDVYDYGCVPVEEENNNGQYTQFVVR